MCIIDLVAAFAAHVPGTGDADIKTRVTAGTAGLAMAGLAFLQVCFGIRAMVGAQEIAAVKGVRRVAGTVRMAA